MNKIKEDHYDISLDYDVNQNSEIISDRCLGVTIKYMKGFGSYLMEYYWKTKGGLYAKIGDEYTGSILNTPLYTEGQVIEEYIKQL